MSENSLFFSDNGYSNHICFNVSVRFNKLIAEQNPNNFSEEQSKKPEFILSLQEQGLGYRRIAKILNDKIKGLYGEEIMSMQFLNDTQNDKID